MNENNPTSIEQDELAITSVRGIELGLGESDPGAEIAAKLDAQYEGHLVLVQAGTFLHGYDRTAYALATLKKYKLKLVGGPHLRIGFPLGGFKRRLWPMIADFGIPYVVALGSQAKGRDVFVSHQPGSKTDVFASVTDKIVAQAIEDLVQFKELNQEAAKTMLSKPDSGSFKLKEKATELDLLLLRDVVKMPRDLRATYGENLRTCMGRILRAVMAYGLEENKPALLRNLSADVDCLKHYLTQAPRLNGLKLKFESRVLSAVELGRIVGGLIRSQRSAS